MQIWSALLGVAIAATPAWGQIDFRNLDRGQPLSIEDAYPIERYAFELSGSYRHQSRSGSRPIHWLEPELSYGIGKGVSFSVAAPLLLQGAGSGVPTGLAGLGASFLGNLTTERPGLPGIGIRVDAALPVGAAAPSGLSQSVGLLGTMSIGRSRVNVSGGVEIRRPDRGGGGETTPLWHFGAQLDRTLIRSSTLLAAEMVVRREASGEPITLAPGIGLRRQLTPTLVLDGGLLFEIRAGARPGSTLTLGVSHLFALAALMPGVRR